MRKLFLLLSVLFVVSCSSGTEEPAPVIKYTLTTSANPTTGGTITPASGQHTEGATVSITATPAAEYFFFKLDRSNRNYSHYKCCNEFK